MKKKRSYNLNLNNKIVSVAIIVENKNISQSNLHRHILVGDKVSLLTYTWKKNNSPNPYTNTRKHFLFFCCF